MNKGYKIMRMVIFYISLMLYIILLPIVLSYSLGSHIDFNTLKIYQTGIIYLNSRPSGAAIYINGRKHPDLTPTQIEELKPGTYRVEVTREGFYPWEQDVVVRPKMVTRQDRIVLFPAAKEMKNMSERDISDFAISDRNHIYYLTDSGLFQSNMDGSPLKKMSPYSNWPKEITGKKFSPDGNKFLYFTEREVGVVYFNLEKSLPTNGEDAKVEEILTGSSAIVDCFWYSTSSYMIVTTRTDIKVVELRGGATRNIISLYKFNADPRGLYYDESNDSLYFTDLTKGPDSEKTARYLYRLDLRQKFFDKFMQRLLKKELESPNGKR